MKRLTISLLAAVALLGWSGPARSQAPRTTVEKLEGLKALNKKLIEQQEANLLKLDEVLKDAQQLRVFARRT